MAFKYHAINFEDQSYGDNKTIQVSDGCYNVSATPAEYYMFEHWMCTGGVNICGGDLRSPSVRVNVTGNGTLTAYYRYTIHSPSIT